MAGAWSAGREWQQLAEDGRGGGGRGLSHGRAVHCARAGQKTPDGYYNLERMLKPLVQKGIVGKAL